MKKTLTFLLLLICFAASAQKDTIPRPTTMPLRFGNSYNLSPGYLRVDGGFLLNNRDTMWTPIRQGTLTYWQNNGVDSTVWLWDSIRWKPFTGGGSGGDSVGYNTVTQLTDTSYTINRFDGTKDTIEFVADTTCGTGGGANTVTLTAGTNISITGSATQSISTNPSWTINAVAQQWKSPIAATFGGAGGVTGSNTNYMQITGRATGFIATESTVQFVMTEATDINNLYVRTSGTQPGDGSIVITLRVNGISRALTATIPAGSSSTTFSDITHTVSVVAGDLVCWQVVNNSSSTGVTILSIGASLTGVF